MKNTKTFYIIISIFLIIPMNSCIDIINKTTVVSGVVTGDDGLFIDSAKIIVCRELDEFSFMPTIIETDYFVYSNSEGKYEIIFEHDRDYRYSINVVRKGYIFNINTTIDHTLPTIKSGATQTINLELSSFGNINLTGKITNINTNMPIADCNITIYQINELFNAEFLATTHSVENGDYNISFKPDFPHITCIVKPEKAGYEYNSGEIYFDIHGAEKISVEPDNSEIINFKLVPD